MLTEAFFKTVKTCSPLKTEERCKPNSFKKDRGKIFKDGKDMLTEASTTLFKRQRKDANQSPPPASGKGSWRNTFHPTS